MRHRAPIFLLCIFLASPVFCQVNNLKFEHKDTEDGLSFSNVLCILQDSRGFMWFGTRNGLNKYDGYTFTIYKNDINDNNSIGNDRIADIEEDADGNLWIATLNGGLEMFDWRTERFTHYRNIPDDTTSISANLLHCVTLDHNGNVWVGTSGGGMCMLDRKKNSFVRYIPRASHPERLTAYSVNDIIEDEHHNLWISTVSNGLSVFDPKAKTFRHFRHDPANPSSLAHNQLEVIFRDSQKRLWIGTRNGLDLLDGNGFKHYVHEPSNMNSLPSNVILSLEEDDEHNIWIGTENGGLSILTPETQTFHNYTHDDVDRQSLNNNSIWSLYKDAQHNMWVGTFSGGINFVNHCATKFTHYRHSSSPNSLSNNSVWSIFEDSRMNLWIGTDGGGINLFDRTKGTFKSYRHNTSPNSLAGDYVLTAAEDARGNIWIGTWGDGVSVFNPKTQSFRNFRYDPNKPGGICSDHAWIIFKDSHDKMWIGTSNNGIDVYDEATDRFKHFGNDPADSLSLLNNTVNFFLEDHRGTLWIATNQGLNRLNVDGQNFARYKHRDDRNSISNNHIYCMAEDAAGNLWIGTDIGLNYFDIATERFTSYFAKDGLPDNTIDGLLIDDQKNLWISTNNGISRFDPEKKIFKNFGISDGLQSTEFKKGACKSKTGQFYFGGIGGLNEFIPDKIKTDNTEPVLKFNGFEVFNKKVPISTDPSLPIKMPQSILASSEITLPYDHSVFSIQFASLNYTSPERKLYLYMLEGFDKEWNGPSPTHAATYTNLDPGVYTFKVKGLTNEGEWSKNTASIKITIVPPYWMTWWFETISGLFVVSGIAFIFMLRTRNITRVNRELTEAVEEKTREINDKNRILSVQREELAAQNEELLQSHEEISAQRDLVAKQNQTLESEVEKRTRELVEYNHQLEQFAFISAHNLRAPVARILGLGNLLDISDEKESQREQIYPKLVNAARELDTVVKDLNTILYLKKNNDTVITLIDLPTEVAIIIENLEHEISQTQATVTTDFAAVSTIRTVKPYLDSILYNLVSNAIKYRHPERKPDIHIKTEKIHNELCLRVSDNGLGIDVDLFQDKLFTLYSRFHLHVEGKGMGLYLVKTQLAAMGGRIEIDSKVDVGTTFNVFFKI